jgi:hypothetical protein
MKDQEYIAVRTTLGTQHEVNIKDILAMGITEEDFVIITRYREYPISKKEFERITSELEIAI